MDKLLCNNNSTYSAYYLYISLGDKACKKGNYSEGKYWYHKGYQLAKELNDLEQVTNFEWLCFSCI